MEEKYYSYRYGIAKAESPYQIVVSKNILSDGTIIEPNNDLLFLKLVGLIHDNRDPLFDVSACLEYHYTKSEVSQRTFLKYTKRNYVAHIECADKLPDIDRLTASEVMEWIKKKEEECALTKPENVLSIVNTKGLQNPHPEIFSSCRGFQIFDKLINLKKKTRYNDYCVFVYRQLIKDGYMIDIKHSVFKDFMNKNYQISLDKFKPLATIINDERFNLYSTVIDSTP
jgi:hypothetical protein